MRTRLMTLRIRANLSRTSRLSQWSSILDAFRCAGTHRFERAFRSNRCHSIAIFQPPLREKIATQMRSGSNEQKAYQLLASLVFEGTNYRLHTDALQPLREDMERRPNISRWATEQWGGYQTDWEVDEDRLYLVDVFGFDLHSSIRLSLTSLFPDHPGGAVLAGWFTGSLACPYGPMHQDASGLYKISEFSLVLEVKEGVVVETRTISNLG